MNRTDRPVVPDGLPRLQAGFHPDPEQGACLMEYVSVLAGTTFSDHPRCTDPTLAELARLVNDASTDEGRPLLAAFAPALVATGPLGDPSRTAAVVRATVRTAAAALDDPAGLDRHLARAERRCTRVTGTGFLAGLARWLEPLHRQGPGRHRLDTAVTALTALPGPRRDAALRGTLAAAVAAATPLVPQRQAPPGVDAGAGGGDPGPLARRG
ncbi:hypothetical protein GCM10027451_17010 [Geodermatophilus aquaeductus]|uniref:Uncharacterized protein n=1 Tax=Geodermatophilus aquaeductus TaxID=1564161 RepID=A0A521E1I4_9ACTN|nr:hypothetical protein [Geodermatophilus aquaeductus]SMO77705.1 hypothetical protein SAMN06273567_104118 [Geodermatophilus aquaeductus]